jgi:hypothetical protein
MGFKILLKQFLNLVTAIVVILTEIIDKYNLVEEDQQKIENEIFSIIETYYKGNPTKLRKLKTKINALFSYDDYLETNHYFYGEFLRLLATETPMNSHNKTTEKFMVYCFLRKFYGKDKAEKAFKDIKDKIISDKWEKFDIKVHKDIILFNRSFDRESHSDACKEENEDIDDDNYKCIGIKGKNRKKRCNGSGRTTGDGIDIIYIDSETKEILCFEVKINLAKRKIAPRQKKTKKSKKRDRGNDAKYVAKKIANTGTNLIENLPKELKDYEIKLFFLTTGYITKPGREEFEEKEIEIYDRQRCYEELYPDKFIEFIEDFDIGKLKPAFGLGAKEIRDYTFTDRLGMIKHE